MAQGWRQYLEAGMQIGEMTRAQAQKLVDQLVKEGQVAEERARSYAEELVKRSRKRTDDLTKLIRKEIQSQLSALGLATKDDVRRLERKLTQSSAADNRSSSRSSSGSTSGRKSTKPS